LKEEQDSKNINDRFGILNNNDFWTNLMFRLSGYFAKSEDKELNNFWIDGFDPTNCSNTKIGINVEGMVWVMEGQKDVHKFRFKVEVPQNLLHKKIEDFKFEVLIFDFSGKKVELRIRK